MIQQKGVCGTVGSSHPPAELVQLGKSHVLRFGNDQGVGVGDVQSGLNNGGGHENIDLAVHKLVHDPLQLSLIHLTVCVGKGGLRHQLFQPGGDICNVVDPVVDIIHLSAPGQFSADRLPDHLLIVFAYKGLDGQPVLRCLLQHAHIPDADEAHMKGPGNRGRRQRQHIHIFLQLLDFFLVGHAEPLLLIDDQQAQVLEGHIPREHSVGADDNIHCPLLQSCNGLSDLSPGSEPAHQLYCHGKILHSLDKGCIMLLGKDSGGHQVDHLLSLLNCLEGGTDGDLRLAVAHVAADQTVHHLPALHVRLGGCDGIQLVLRLLKGKHLLEFLLPYRIRSVLIALCHLSGGIQLHQFIGHFLHGRLHLGLGLLPILGSDAVDLRLGCIGGSIFLQHVKGSGKYKQGASLCILDPDIVLFHTLVLDLLDSAIDSHAVMLMDHIVSYGQIIVILDAVTTSPGLPALFLFLFRAEDIRLRQHDKPDIRIFKPSGNMAVKCDALPGQDLPVGILRIDCGEIVVP